MLPLRDAAATLDVCLASIRRQTEPDWECVAVDDGSTDGTREILAAAGRADSRIRAVSTAHRGLIAALNAGLELCRGALVARMDGDDVMHRARLAEQAAVLDRDGSLTGAGCHVRVFPRDVMTDGGRAYERWLNGIRDADAVARDAFVECPVVHPTLMLRRETFAKYGYHDRGWPEDYDLILRLLGDGQRIGMLPRRRLGWREHPDRLSRTDPAYNLQSFTKCRAAHLAASFLADGERYVLWGHGGTGRALRRELAALGKRPSHIVEVHPRRIGNVIDGAPVIAVEALAGLPRDASFRLVASVAGSEARGLIREALDGMGFVETRDYVCAA